jgi:tetratricopeptide (TPR) repeat protein
MSRALAGLALSLVLIGGADAEPAPPEQAVEQNNQGARLVKEGKLEDATAALRRALEQDPTYVTARMNLAYAYELRGRTDDAIAEYEKVLAAQAGHVVARNNLGVLYDRTGSHDRAIEQFAEILRRDPANGAATKNLATAKRNQSIVVERAQQFAAAQRDVDARPRDPRAAYQMARLHALYDDTDQALTWLGRALELGLPETQFPSTDPAFARVRVDPRFERLVRGSPATGS